MQFLQTTFGPLVLIFTVSNLAAMGLQVRMPEVLVALRNKTSMALIFVWGWVVGPAFGYLITRVLPLAEPYVVVVFLCQPGALRAVPPADGGKSPRRHGLRGSLRAAGDGRHGGVDAVDGPLLIKGVTISTSSLAKPLLLTILLPLIIGAAIRHFADKGATRIFPAVKGLALLSTLLTIVWCLVLYGRGMLDTAGELALLSMTLFMVGMGLITYRFGFGMKQNQRSVMALGMGTRNIAAVLAAALAIPNGDPRIVVMTIMWTLWSVVLAAIGAKIFANGRQDRPERRGVKSLRRSRCLRADLGPARRHGMEGHVMSEAASSVLARIRWPRPFAGLRASRWPTSPGRSRRASPWPP